MTQAKTMLVTGGGIAHKAPLCQLTDTHWHQTLDIADVILFLASHQARCVTGQVIVTDGGLAISSQWGGALRRRGSTRSITLTRPSARTGRSNHPG